MVEKYEKMKKMNNHLFYAYIMTNVVKMHSGNKNIIYMMSYQPSFNFCFKFCENV